MDLFSLFLLTHENNEIKSPTKIYDFTVFCLLLQCNIYMFISKRWCGDGGVHKTIQ